MGQRLAVPTSGRTRRSMARRAALGPIATIGRSATTLAMGKLGLPMRRPLLGRLSVRMLAVRGTGSIASSRSEDRTPAAETDSTLGRQQRRRRYRPNQEDG